MLITYESAGLPSLDDLTAPPNAMQAGIIPYAVTDPQGFEALRARAAYVYVTDDTLPNPWDTLPAYFDALLE